MQEPGFWDDQERAAKVSAEHAAAGRKLSSFRKLESDLDDLEALEELAAEDDSIADELQRAQQSQAMNGGGLQYEHESLAGAEAIAAAGGGAGGATATLAMTGGGTTSTAGAPRPIVKSDKENIGRNEPCWCGSGKKFKKCHGA